MTDLIDWLIGQETNFRKSRLPSLYSDLAVQRTTNSEGYAANILAWQSALTRAAEAGKLSTDSRLTLRSSEELLDRLASSQYGRPSSLGLVLDESVKSGKMFELKDFKATEQSIYHRTWIPSPWTVLRWGLKQAGLAGNASYDNSGRLRAGTLVLIPALEDVHKQITVLQTKMGNTLTDRVMTREAFTNHFARFNDQVLSPQDIDVLLRYLERDRGLLTYDAKTVKFKSIAAESPEPITSEDSTIANLKAVIEGLESQIEKLNIRISSLQQIAKTAVESKNKPAALSALRSKKLAEGALQQRTDTLARMEEVFTKIEEAVDQVQIVEVMQSSVSVLKGLNKKIGGVERVEDVVEELREEMGKVDEVGQVLQEPLDSQMVLNEDEVDDELEQMEQEEKRKQEEQEAQRTKERFEELESTRKQEQQKEPDDAGKQAEDEHRLRNSIEMLDRMTITGDKDTESSMPEAIEARQKVPEQAS